MSAVRKIALGVLLISFFTFVAFFGRLPALRNTPIGALHRVIWIHTPAAFQAVDKRLTNGRFSRRLGELAHTLWNDRHPLVMIFFILLLSVSEVMFVPPAWPLMAMIHKVNACIAIVLPYVFLYASAATDPGYITSANHPHAMTLYPYDFTIFYPGQECKTCTLLKPPRSKHCSICKHCISKLDHHCIFINNCVGYRNQHYFLSLLLCTAALTTYATCLGTTLLSGRILEQVPSWTLRGHDISWNNYFQIWAWVLQEHTRIGAITLLCLLTSPLIWGLLGYHIYLIWAGTTTNESMKWSDWQAEMADGFVFKRKLPVDRFRDERTELSGVRWPVDSQQILIRTEDGKPPNQSSSFGVGEWERVWKLRNVENIYDLGFLDNLLDVLVPRDLLRWGAAPVKIRSDGDDDTDDVLVDANGARNSS